ncbi:endo-14-beta-xylanase [Fusarium albosuccineum]|uniref:Beta-xylanase n=1 Tax=Fusarium albosuccineum TaxID=1237068 RepID=A0A8H4P3M3_9HYPO|nr:endo-14-beta-xylanase [Fusarium albosuccineum]
MYKTAALLGLVVSSPVSAQLNSLAQAAGLEYFGSAVDNGYLSDTSYSALANDVEEFGQLVPENGQKWDSTEPSRNQFSYTKADVVPDLAKKNGQVLRCHALTWHSQLPSWVSSGGFTAEELTSIIEAHISNVVGHYKGDCYAWDVVNEAIGDDGNWRDSVFYQTLGTDYLAISFNAARKADPDAKLYYNDYNLEYNGAKTERALELVKIVQDAGAPIDGVGFQGHLIVGSTPSRSSLTTVLKRFTALDVEVAYTELDIRHASVPASEAALKTQGDDFANVVGSCLDVEGCVGVTIWGVTDKYSWVPNTFEGAGEALIYNEDYEKKPAWTSISSLLAAAATGSSAGTATSAAATVEATAPATTLQTRTRPAFSSSKAVAVPETTSLVVTPFLNTTVPETTLQTRTSDAAPVASEVDDEDDEDVDDDCEEDEDVEPIPTYVAPGNGTQIQPTQAPIDESTAAAETEAPVADNTRVPIIRHSSSAYFPWNTQPAAVPTYPAGPTGTAPSVPIGTGTAKHYYQCGGRGYTGPTQCEEGYTCQEQNEWYHQPKAPRAWRQVAKAGVAETEYEIRHDISQPSFEPRAEVALYWVVPDPRTDTDRSLGGGPQSAGRGVGTQFGTKGYTKGRRSAAAIGHRSAGECVGSQSMDGTLESDIETIKREVSDEVELSATEDATVQKLNIYYTIPSLPSHFGLVHDVGSRGRRPGRRWLWADASPITSQAKRPARVITQENPNFWELCGGKHPAICFATEGYLHFKGGVPGG